MKKTILLLSMIFAVVANISAQSITISATSDGKTYTSTGEIKTSTETTTRTAVFSINLSGTSTTETAAFQYDINVPKGYKVDETSFVSSNTSLTANSMSYTRIGGNNDYDGSVYRVVYGKETAGENFNGEICRFTVSVDKTLEGSSQIFTVNNFIISNLKKSSIYNADLDIDLSVGTYTTITVPEATFTVTQPAPTTAELDETSTESITEQLKKYNVSPGQEIDNLTIKRTINPGKWSTIILPVNLTETEIKSAFGDDAVLADFDGFDADSMSTTGQYYKWYFYTSTHKGSMLANTPYFLKASKEVTNIELKNKTISDPGQSVSKSIGQSKKIYAGRNIAPLNFTGYYTPHKMVQGDVFLSSNKFWFANTNTQELKGFRAFVEFVQQAGLSFDTNESSSVKFYTNLNEESSDVTGIENVNRVDSTITDGKVYNLSGVYVGNDLNNLPSGLYIRNGKKILVK